ncbi:MAG: hypothetical protein U0Q16_06735 [Bryobacteraceae bacterium]
MACASDSSSRTLIAGGSLAELTAQAKVLAGEGSPVKVEWPEGSQATLAEIQIVAALARQVRVVECSGPPETEAKLALCGLVCQREP